MSLLDLLPNTLPVASNKIEEKKVKTIADKKKAAAAAAKKVPSKKAPRAEAVEDEEDDNEIEEVPKAKPKPKPKVPAKKPKKAMTKEEKAAAALKELQDESAEFTKKQDEIKEKNKDAVADRKLKQLLDTVTDELIASREEKKLDTMDVDTLEQFEPDNQPEEEQDLPTKEEVSVAKRTGAKPTPKRKQPVKKPGEEEDGEDDDDDEAYLGGYEYRDDDYYPDGAKEDFHEAAKQRDDDEEAATGKKRKKRRSSRLVDLNTTPMMVGIRSVDDIHIAPLPTIRAGARDGSIVAIEKVVIPILNDISKQNNRILSEFNDLKELIIKARNDNAMAKELRSKIISGAVGLDVTEPEIKSIKKAVPTPSSSSSSSTTTPNVSPPSQSSESKLVDSSDTKRQSLTETKAPLLNQPPPPPTDLTNDDDGDTPAPPHPPQPTPTPTSVPAKTVPPSPPVSLTSKRTPVVPTGPHIPTIERPLVPIPPLSQAPDQDSLIDELVSSMNDDSGETKAPTVPKPKPTQPSAPTEIKKVGPPVFETYSSTRSLADCKRNTAILKQKVAAIIKQYIAELTDPKYGPEDYEQLATVIKLTTENKSIQGFIENIGNIKKLEPEALKSFKYLFVIASSQIFRAVITNINSLMGEAQQGGADAVYKRFEAVRTSIRSHAKFAAAFSELMMKWVASTEISQFQNGYKDAVFAPSNEVQSFHGVKCTPLVLVRLSSLLLDGPRDAVYLKLDAAGASQQS